MHENSILHLKVIWSNEMSNKSDAISVCFNQSDFDLFCYVIFFGVVESTK